MALKDWKPQRKSHFWNITNTWKNRRVGGVAEISRDNIDAYGNKHETFKFFVNKHKFVPKTFSTKTSALRFAKYWMEEH